MPITSAKKASVVCGLISVRRLNLAKRHQMDSIRWDSRPAVTAIEVTSSVPISSVCVYFLGGVVGTGKP